MTDSVVQPTSPKSADRQHAERGVFASFPFRFAARVVPAIVTAALLWALLKDVDSDALAQSLDAAVDSPWWWIALTLSVTSHIGLSALKWGEILGGLGSRQPWTALAYLEAAADLFIRVIPLRAGELAKIWHLASRRGVPVLVTTSSIALDIATSLGALVILAASGFLAMTVDSVNVGIGGAMLLLTATVLFARAILRFISESFGARAKSASGVWANLSSYSSRASNFPVVSIAKVGLLGVVIEFSEILVVAMLCRATGVEVPFATLFALWPIASILGGLPISIGGTGVRDGAFLALVLPLGSATYEQALAVGITFTLVGVLIPCAAGFPLTIHLLSSMANATRQRTSILETSSGRDEESERFSAREDGAARPRP